jgi:uncharacterized protein
MSKHTYLKSGILFLLLLILFSVASQTYTVDKIPNDHLNDKYDFVSNPDGIISYQAEQRLNDMLVAIQDEATAEVAVVLLKSIGDADIDLFGTELFTQWGIGKRQKDNGLLFLLVEDQRQMIFRTGYGLEGVLPDIILSRIIRNDIAPLMKQSNYDQAILAGITKIKEYLLNPETVQEIIAQEKNQQHEKNQLFLRKFFMFYLVFSLCVFLIFIYLLTSRTKKDTNFDKYNSLNAIRNLVIGCTIFFPLLMLVFIFIYFSKLKTIRNSPVSCPQCNRNMEKQNETEEKNYLTVGQSEEERLKSVDYDVWLCRNCGHNEIFAYDNPHSKYTSCPHCRVKTYSYKSERIIKNATVYSQGKGEKIYECSYCKKRDVIPYIIPMIVISSGSGRKNGGFGGGGNFSGGSFGGGHTGGGGARGGW